MEATSRTSPLPLRLKSGKSLSSVLWWKTLISSLPWIWTVWTIPFEEYIFDTSLALFNLWQLKASWWSELVKFSFTIFWDLVYQILRHQNFWISSYCTGSAHNILDSPTSLWSFLCDGSPLYPYGTFECQQLQILNKMFKIFSPWYRQEFPLVQYYFFNHIAWQDLLLFQELRFCVLSLIYVIAFWFEDVWWILLGKFCK